MAGHLSAREAVRRLKAYRSPEVQEGFKWISLEYNDYGNAARVAEYRQACADEDVIFTIWMTRNFSAAEALQACVESQADGFLAEAEIAAEIATGVPNPQAQNWPELIHALKDIPIYKGVVTNFAPFLFHDGTPNRDKAKPLIDAGWSCHTECYDRFGDPTTWIDSSDWFAKVHLGWPRTQPAVGLFAGRTWASFPQFDQYANGSVWAAEYLI
jgi:hypothetical protein